MTIPNGQFYEILPSGKWHIRFDAHLIADFNDCDRYFQYRHVTDQNGLVWRPKGFADSFKMSCGSWWSRVMELFYQEMTHGHMPSSTTILQFAGDAWRELDMDRFAGSDPQETKKYEQFKGAEGAALMALEYWDAYAEIDFRQWTIVGAEKGFGLQDEILVGEDDDIVVHYTGKPDLVFIDNDRGDIVPLDFKTKDHVPSNVSSMWKPHPQTAGYIVACNELAKQVNKQSTRCCIRVCARLRPSDKPRDGVRKPRFGMAYPNYSLDELQEWRESAMSKARRLRYAIEHNSFIPRESACHLFSGCAFRRVCSVPRQSRPMVLQADFQKVEPWSPYSTEED